MTKEYKRGVLHVCGRRQEKVPPNQVKVCFAHLRIHDQWPQGSQSIQGPVALLGLSSVGPSSLIMIGSLRKYLIIRQVDRVSIFNMPTRHVSVRELKRILNKNPCILLVR